MGKLAIACIMVACSLISFEMMTVEATTVRVHNQCSYTVCSKYWVPNSSVGGSCSEQRPGGTWSFNVSPSWVAGTVWPIPHTGCAGQACNTGPPYGITQFEITAAARDGNDYYDISALAGFNVPMKVVPTNGNCPSVDCRGANAGACPEGYYPGGPDKTKGCRAGSTDYDIYLCPGGGLKGEEAGFLVA